MGFGLGSLRRAGRDKRHPEDLASLIGTDVYRAGTPQRAQLDARIAGLAEDELSCPLRQSNPLGGAGSPPGRSSPIGGHAKTLQAATCGSFDERGLGLAQQPPDLVMCST